jgi:hypothetical protein
VLLGAAVASACTSALITFSVFNHNRSGREKIETGEQEENLQR